MLHFEQKNTEQLLIENKRGMFGLGLRHIAMILMFIALIVGSIPALWALVKMDFQTALPSASLLIFFVFSGVFGFFKALDPIGGDISYVFDKHSQTLLITDRRWHTTRRSVIPFQEVKGLDIEKDDATTFRLSLQLEGGKKHKIENAGNPEILQEYAQKISNFMQGEPLS